jgi:hypothetical protein
MTGARGARRSAGFSGFLGAGTYPADRRQGLYPHNPNNPLRKKKIIKKKILLMLVGVRGEWGGRGTNHQTRRQVMALWHFGTMALWHYNPHNPHILGDQVGTKKR